MIINIGTYTIPVIIALAGICILSSKSDLTDEFFKGCKEGISTTFKILPNLIMIICAVRMFSASGAESVLTSLLSPLFNLFKIPESLISVILMRILSGSAATASVNELFGAVGADSFEGICASIIMGASDTIIYTLSMYFGASGIKRTRHALPCAFLILFFCVVFSVMLTNLFF